MNKKRKIEVSSDTYNFLCRIRNDIGDFDQVIQHYINDPSFSQYALGKYGKREGRNLLLRLPFEIRLLIIEMVPDMELKFFLRPSGIIKSFQKNRNISTSEYIQELFGVFQEDKVRKIYLVFRRMGIKTGVSIGRRFKILPQKNTILSFRYQGGSVLDTKEEIESKIPSGMNKIHTGIKCLTFVLIRSFRVDSIICIVSNLKFVTRLRFSELDFSPVTSEDMKKLVQLFLRQKSLSLIKCKGLTGEILYPLFESKSIMKLAIGNNQLRNLSFPSHLKKNSIVRYMYLQNNLTDVNVRPSNFPFLRVLNISNTCISYNNLLNVLQHPVLRKLMVVHVRLNRNETQTESSIQLEEINEYYEEASQRPRILRKHSENLEFLSLNSTKLDERFCRYIGLWCKSLVTLMVSKCDINARKFSLLRLEEKKRLRVLHIGWNKINEDNIQNLVEKCPSVEKLVTPQDSINMEFASIVLSSKHLKSLSFRSKRMLELKPKLLEKIRESNLHYLNLIHHRKVTEENINFIKYHCLQVRVFKYSFPEEEDRVEWTRHNKVDEDFIVPESQEYSSK